MMLNHGSDEQQVVSVEVVGESYNIYDRQLAEIQSVYANK